MLRVRARRMLRAAPVRRARPMLARPAAAPAATGHAGALPPYLRAATPPGPPPPPGAHDAHAQAKPGDPHGEQEHDAEGTASAKAPHRDADKAAKGLVAKAHGKADAHERAGAHEKAAPTKAPHAVKAAAAVHRGGAAAGGGGAPAAVADSGGGGGGGGEAASGGELATTETSAAEERAQEHVEEKLEQAAPANDEEHGGEGAPEAPASAAAPPATPEALSQASEAADAPAPPVSSDDAEAASGSDAESAAPAEPAAPEPKPAEPAAAANDPEAFERANTQVEAREAQRDTQRAAEAGTEDRAQEHSEQQADAGEPAGASAELSGEERGTGMAAVAEPAEDGGGGGGEAAAPAAGGGGAAPPVPEPEPAPDTASGDPESGLASAATLQPVQAAQALNGVGTSIDNTAKAEGESLQSQIPKVEVGGDGSGGSAVVRAGEGDAAKGAKALASGRARPMPEPKPLPPPGPAPTARIAIPFVSDTNEGKVRREDAMKVASSVENMPTTDPSIDTSAGPPPTLLKTGDANPNQMDRQRAELDGAVTAQKAQGARDAAQPAGETQVRDRTKREALAAPKLAASAAAAQGAAVPDEEAVGIIAEQKQGDEVRGAMAQAQGDMASRRTEHESKVSDEKAKSNAEIAELKRENAAEQKAEKDKVVADVGRARADWTGDQDAEGRKADDKAAKEIAKGNDDIAKEEKQGNDNAAKEISSGEKEAAEAKEAAEKEAAEKKREAEKKKEEDSGGIFGWIASKVSAFFDALKSAITKVFDAAKKLVKAAIDKAKKLAVAAIEAARKAVVGLIKAVGAALIAIGDVMLAAFPGLKKKWRGFIESKVKSAEDAVNRLADALKKGVTKLLDALGKAFEFLLDAYKKAMLAVLDVAKGIAMAAIKVAKAIADAIGTWITIIKDIASGPMDWLSKLGSAAVDGIKNHLWNAFQRDVKEWFNAKLEEVLGLGMTIWNVLSQGGIKMAEIGTMVFEALKAAIPAALIQLLIEKLVAMIIPAAGAVMAIIEGLQAAWGTIQRILSAIGRFIAFLKAVKGGGAGPQFADMLSAAAIVVIDFVANWLLKRLRKPASKVGGKIKAIAQKIMAKIKSAAKKVGGALKRAAGKIGSKIKAGFGKIKKKFTDWRAKRKAKKDAKHKDKPDANKKKQDKEANKRERLRKAVTGLRPKIEGAARGGKLSGLLLKAKLAFWKLTYRLSSLQLKEGGGSATVTATVNPSEEIKRFVARFGAQLRKLIYEAADNVMDHPKVQEAAAKAAAIVDGKPVKDASGKDVDPKVESGAESLAVSKELARKRAPGESADVDMGSGGSATITRDPLKRSKDPEGAPPGLQLVEGGGSYVNHPQEFKAAASTAGVSEQDLHKATVATFLGGGTVAASAQEVKDFGAKQALLKICEISRNCASGLISVDTAREAANGRMDTAAAVASDPMTGVALKDKRLSPEKEGYHERAAAALKEPDPTARAKLVESKGAVATNKRVEELGRAGREPTGKAKRVRRVIKQQLDFVARVLQVEYEAGRMLFTDETHLTKDLEQQIEKAILRRFKELTGLPE